MTSRLVLLFAILAMPAFARAADMPNAIEMVRVAGGCFDMGSRDGEKHELPVHKVCVDDFEIGKFEVTQAQWKAVMGTNPSKFNGCGDQCPVDQVSWNAVQEFINRLNAQNKGGYRLPTEAEWEYACRSGGKNERFPGGVAASAIGDIAWYKIEGGVDGSQPVGKKKANGLGLHDMAGNVWEWVQDKFVSPYPSAAVNNPKIESGGEEKRVMRGGSWHQKVNYVRCGIRARYPAEFVDSRVGVRLVRDVAK